MNLERIGKYDVISTIGRGSMGIIYKARDPEIGRLVAIKTMRNLPVDGDQCDYSMLERFSVEAKSAGRLRHRNIVTVFEIGKTDDGVQFIVMDYIEGDSLDTILNKVGWIEPLEAIHYLAQIATAIDYAHANDVYHRDIKPSNIIIDKLYCPHLLDFGVAKISDTSITPVGTVVGTPSYMSPEQIRGSDEGGGTDIFALAVMSFEMFTGSRPFSGKDFVSVVANIIHGDPMKFSEIDVELPPKLEKVLCKGFAKQKADRYVTASEFVLDVAYTFGITIDANGIAGGFSSGMKVSDITLFANESAKIKTTLNKRVGSSLPKALCAPTKANSQNFVDDLEHKEVAAIVSGTHTPVDSRNLFDVSNESHSKGNKSSVLSDRYLMCFVSVIGAVILVLSIWVLSIKKSSSGIKMPERSSDNFATQSDIRIKSEIELQTPKTLNEEFAINSDTVGLNQNIALSKDPKAEQYISLLVNKKCSPSEIKDIIEYIISTRRRDLLEAFSRWCTELSFADKLQTVRLLEDMSSGSSSDSVVFALKLFVKDSDSLIRAKAVKIIGTFRSEDAIKILEGRLGEEKDHLVLQMIREGLSAKPQG